ncbi:MAG: small multi-drug export protein [Oscillospiraceae bacterium]
MVRYIIVFFISMVPIVELRGAIPIGVALELPHIANYIVCVLGNMLPVPIILLFAKAILLWCCKWKHGGKFFTFIYEKGVKAGKKLTEKTGQSQYVALFLFVAIPLPGTGAWTGCLAATLLDMKFWPSVLAVAGGVLVAGIIMALASFGVFGAIGLLV